ncbi:putative hydrolase or acyltransferase of alpha beta superfamily protein [Neofusicoccum parvum UCRNP2]|uniref:Putative hydrolase or acyltransferase of alpha beta superfamily protein n=1 Tax=Botryosphaeria parva (strain UCR-NP2) TaxID=1287680 RepID=R1E840_BOTPV|nr:putative hydrolase or acyltransferase of alpha beta superfamily protein [Neofusicoccum parvum UCRNP2]
MELIYETLDLVVDGVQLQVSTVRRDGTKAPLVFLHGFGSTKEDYVDLAYHPDFTDRPFLAYDAPGCGATTCSDLSAISIPFLVATAQAILQHHRITQFHLVGHSMGGLTALLLAAAAAPPTSILSFTDIEGNLAPEDCFLSRQIATHHHASPASFLAAFAARAARAPAPASALYAAALPRKVRAGAVRAIFESMVALSDGGGLLRTFLSLPCPAMFMHGDRNAGLTYLPRLAAAGVELAEVPLCAHFPMYSNPVEMWRRIGGFLARVED